MKSMWCFSNHTNLLHVWIWVDGSGGEGHMVDDVLSNCMCTVLGDTVALLISVNYVLIILLFASYHWLPPSESFRTSRVDITETLLLWQTAPLLCNAREFAIMCLSSLWLSGERHLSWRTHHAVWRIAHAVSLGAQSDMEERILGIWCMNSLMGMYEKKR